MLYYNQQVKENTWNQKGYIMQIAGFLLICFAIANIGALIFEPLEPLCKMEGITDKDKNNETKS